MNPNITTMNKDALVQAIADGAEISKTQAERALSSFVSAVTSTLKSGDSLTISGFGTFKVSHRAARQGVNPKTGERIQIAAATVPKFSAGKGLKEAVR